MDYAFYTESPKAVASLSEAPYAEEGVVVGDPPKLYPNLWIVKTNKYSNIINNLHIVSSINSYIDIEETEPR